MNFKIKKIILWPKDVSFSKKEIDFELEKVNVIVGDSQTGKSSIIPIIDYCLCSSKCTIPVGPIRKSTAWFGILVVSGETELLLVREEPGIQQSTNRMYFEENKNIIIPEKIIESNRNAEQVSRRLNQLCKLPSLDFAEDASARQPYEARPSFKDFLAFNFQSQHIIANPYTLFYQADTIEHKLKLRTIFPLALGLIQSSTLELQRRIANLNEQLKEKRGVLEQKAKIRNAWESEIRGNYVKALQLGILKEAPFPEETWKLEDFVVYLQEVPNLIKQIQYPALSQGITSRVIKYTAKVQKNEQDILDKLEEKSFRLSTLRNFKNSSSDYEFAVRSQQSRLEPVNNGWLHTKINKLDNCPVCGSTNLAANENVKKLINVADSIKEKISQINDSKDILDKEITETESEIQELEKQLNNARIQLEALGRENESMERQRSSMEEIFRYVGKLEQNLKNLDETKIDSELSSKITELEQEIKKLQAELNISNNQQTRDAVIKRIAQSIIFYKKILKVEEAENPTEIDERQLTLKITSKDNREDYLWEIGSGSNWMGYHISTILALQEHFLSLKLKNHTPTFVIFDQPSQAYFPESIKNDEAKQKERSSDDLDRVKAIFVAFSEFMKRTKMKCQVIVLEHASSEFWGTVELTHQVSDKRWIKGDALIPEEWIV
jgi:FtsZ-binding cell division protein ZapB